MLSFRCRITCTIHAPEYPRYLRGSQIHNRSDSALDWVVLSATNNMSFGAAEHYRCLSRRQVGWVHLGLCRDLQNVSARLFLGRVLRNLRVQMCAHAM